MQAFDASSMIYAWDNYPILQFPGLWEWMAAQIEEKNLVIPSVAFDEVANKSPECATWLETFDIPKMEITNTIAQDAMRIKRLLGIDGDNYHPKGVGENDLFIIATARDHGAELVSNEGRQKSPDLRSKLKIPAVCSMKEVSVPCIDFLEFIKRSDRVFR
jgi:predicted nucleic acid-binding protein